MYIILRYEGKIISLDLSTSTPELIGHFIKRGADIVEYKNSR